jgi:putative transposase
MVIIGVTARGQKRLPVIEDGVRGSPQNWREVLLNLKSRGMNAPKQVIGEGAMGIWAACDEVYPEARQQKMELAPQTQTGSPHNPISQTQDLAKDQLHI